MLRDVISTLFCVLFYPRLLIHNYRAAWREFCRTAKRGMPLAIYFRLSSYAGSSLDVIQV